MRDPYEILGVQKNATPAAIKSAFRRLAKKLHPDANKTDKTAATKFSELNAAYEIVGDEAKRKAFDRGEIDAEGKPRFQGFRRRRWPRARRARAAAAGPGQDSNFEIASPGARMDFSAAAAAAAAAVSRRRRHRRHSQGNVRWRGGRRRPAAQQFEQEDFGGAAAGRDVTGTVTITLPEVSDRHLPPRPSADRQGDRRQNPGRSRRRPDHPAEGAGPAGPRRRRGRRADHRHHRRASVVQARRRQPSAGAAGDAL